MRRREFITVLGGAAVWPISSGAQQLPVVGVIDSGSARAEHDAVFRDTLLQNGFAEGRNVALLPAPLTEDALWLRGAPASERS
jgi:putative tryptophan/tyrosine transport system substrate-binding protein